MYLKFSGVNQINNINLYYLNLILYIENKDMFTPAQETNHQSS